MELADINCKLDPSFYANFKAALYLAREKEPVWSKIYLGSRGFCFYSLKSIELSTEIGFITCRKRGKKKSVPGNQPVWYQKRARLRILPRG